MKNLLLAIVLMISVVMISSHAASTKKNFAGTETVPGVIVVKFSAPETLAKLSSSAWIRFQGKYSVTGKEPLIKDSPGLHKKGIPGPLDNVCYIYYSSPESPQQVARELVAAGVGVEYAEPKYIHYLVGTEELLPNDPMYNEQLELLQVKAADAWSITRGLDGDVVIAIVDGGTEITHPDLAANIWINPGEIPGDGLDNDDNGYIDDVNGWNFAVNNNNPAGLESTPINANHGTHTAGTAAAVSNNNTGMAGVSWNATIMPVNAGDAVTDNSISHGYDGIKYAAENGADIISCSWGRGGAASIFEQSVINYATSLGAVVVAAAGNDYNEYNFYPASYNAITSVAAVAGNDIKAGFSNFGPTVDMAAPGVSILGTVTGGQYAKYSGTSMACPIAAGIIALVKTKNPAWNGLQAAEQVRVSADNIDAQNPSFAGKLGKGRVNALRALTVESPSVRIDSFALLDNDDDDIIGPGSVAQITVKVKNYLKAAENISFELTCDDPYIDITEAGTQLSTLGTLQEAVLERVFKFSVREDVQSGHVVDMIVKISSTDYTDEDHIRFMVLPTFTTTDVNDIKVTVTNIGRIGFSDIDVAESGKGFSYKDSPNLLFEGALIAGTSVNNISNAARGLEIAADQDFEVAINGDLKLITPGTVSDQETFGIFEDINSATALPIRIVQSTYADNSPGKAGLVIFKYQIINLGLNTLDNFHFGMFLDWDMDGDNFITNKTEYDVTDKMGYTYDTGSGPKTYAGVSLLTEQIANYRAIYNDHNAPDNPSWGIYDGFTDTKKWESISGEVQFTEAGPADVSMVIAAGPVNIPAGQKEVIAFAMLAGDDLAQLQQHADSAQAYWNYLITVGIDDQDDESGQVHTFDLEQNYPNPFNPETKIVFTLARSGPVELIIYNLLGEKVANLSGEQLRAGRHEVVWNAAGHPSGIYIYQLRAGDYVEQKKMLLLK